MALLDLPPEIRMLIYQFTLTDPPCRIFPSPWGGCDGDPITLCHFVPVVYPDQLGKELALPLLQTCQQIYLEAKEIFYKHNTFGFAGSLIHLFESFPAKYICYVHHI